MTVKEASAELGCSQRHVRTLITKGVLKASKIRSTVYGYWWAVEHSSVVEYEKHKQSKGWPRGKPRRKE